ncbi:hypothetical protein MACJ_000478 [Theileria orientalis]|uniref:Uncharacterized protein n=1 Tax=Theileria orientalis TaxID=68886 RepID=A0A976QQH7_THEOR|nr:hypothetical protein MACJ_000478 [Theileria orientalis]
MGPINWRNFDSKGKEYQKRGCGTDRGCRKGYGKKVRGVEKEFRKGNELDRVKKAIKELEEKLEKKSKSEDRGKEVENKELRNCSVHLYSIDEYNCAFSVCFVDYTHGSKGPGQQGQWFGQVNQTSGGSGQGGSAGAPASQWLLVESSDLAGSDSSGAVATSGSDGTASSISQSGEDSENQASKATGEGKVAESSDSTFTGSSAGTPPAKTGFDLDVGSADQSTNEFEHKRDDNYVTYTAKDNHAFKAVKDGTTNVWEATDSTEYSSKVEVDIITTDSKAVTVYYAGNKTKVFVKGSGSESFTEVDLSKNNPKTVNIKRKSTTHFYTNELQGDVRTFTARTGFAFNVVIESAQGTKVDIWQKAQHNEFANKIEVEGDNKVTIHIGEGTSASKKVFKKGTDGKWEEDTSGQGTGTDGSGTSQSGEGKVAKGSDLTAGTPAAKTGVDLNLTSQASTSQFEYEKDDQHVTYTAKGNNAFKTVKDDKTEVWKANNANEYSSKVEVETSDDVKSVTIHLADDKKRIFTKDGKNEPWGEIYEDRINPKSVNIKYDKETYFHSNSLEGSKRTFEAPEGFAFNCAFEYVNNKKVEIWKTSNENEFANKIEVEGDNKVTIHIGEGTTASKKVFTKGSNNTWAEDTSSQGTLTAGQAGTTPSAGEGKVAESSDSTSTGSPADGSTTKTGIDLDILLDMSTSEFEYKKDDNYVTYSSKDNYAFKAVKDGPTEVWKAADASGYTSKVEVDMPTNYKVVTVYLDGDTTKVYKKDTQTGKWSEFDTTKVNPITLNVNSQHTTYYCTHKLENNVRTLSAKKGFKFNDVNEGSGINKVEIWKTTNVNEYANKIVNEGGNKVTIHIGEGTTASKKVFTKGSDGKWTEDTSSQGTLTAGQAGTTPSAGEGKVAESSDSTSTGSPADGSTTKTGIDLDILLDMSTSEFEYKKDDNYVTYSSKDNYAFKAVKDGTTNVWEATDSTEYSSKVEVDIITTNSKAVTVYMADNKTKVFVKGSGSESFTEVDLSKNNPKTVNIKRKSTTHFYTNELQGDVRTFTARTGFAFNVVIESAQGTKVDIWQKAQHNEFANKIEVEGDNKVTIHIGEGTSASKKVFKKGTDGKWEEDTSGQGTGTDGSGAGTPAAKTGVDLNLTSQASTSQFEYEKDDQHVTYTAKGNNAFKTVKDDKTEVWKANNANEYSSKVEVETSDDVKSVTIHLADDKKRIFTKDGKNEPWGEIYEDRINPKSVNIKYDKETYFHSNSLEGSKRTFEAPEGFAFNCAFEYVNNKKVEIWKTSNENEFANKIEVEGDNKVTIHIGEGTTASKKVFTKGSNNTWAEDTSSQGTLTAGQAGTTPSAGEGKVAESSDSTSTGSPADGSTTKTGIDLDILLDMSTSEFEYKKDDNYVTYSSKDNYAFKAVKDGPTEVWKAADASGYTSKVEVDMPTNYKVVTVYLDGDTTKVYKKDTQTGKWSEFDTTKVNPITLNVNSQHTTYYCTHKLENNVRTLSAKKGFKFNDVNEGSGINKVEIWKTTNVNEYANKIVNEGGNKVTIHIGEGTTASKKVFTKGSDGKWTEDTSSQGTLTAGQAGTTPSAGEGKVAESSDSTFTGSSAGTPPAKTGFDLDVGSADQSTNEFEHKRDDNYVTYTAKDNHAFKAVKDGTTNVWEATDSTEYSSKVEVDIITTNSKAVTVYMADNKTKVFKKDHQSGKWTEFDTTKNNPITLDINREHTTYFCINKLDNNVRTFEAKKGFAFNDVVQMVSGTKVQVWKALKVSEYSKKVVKESDNKVSIHTGQTNVKVFEKGSDNAWAEDSNASTKATNEKKSAQSQSAPASGSGTTPTSQTNPGTQAPKSASQAPSTGLSASTGTAGTHVASGTQSQSSTPTQQPSSTSAQSHSSPTQSSTSAPSQPQQSPASQAGTQATSADNSQTSSGTTPQSKQSTETKTSGQPAAKSQPASGGSSAPARPPPPRSGSSQSQSSSSSTSKTGVDLNLTSQAATNEFDYTKDDQHVTYTAKGNNAFKTVKDDKTEVWKANNANEYSSKVEVETSDDVKSVTIHLADDKKRIFTKDGKNEPWGEIYEDRINPKSVNIKYDKETYFHSNSLEGSKRTFEAPEGFAFNCAFEYVNNKKVEIWKTSNENEFANKIEVEGDNKVTIHIGEGTTASKKVFTKGSNNTWAEDTSGQGTGTASLTGTQAPKSGPQQPSSGKSASTVTGGTAGTQVSSGQSGARATAASTISTKTASVPQSSSSSTEKESTSGGFDWETIKGWFCSCCNSSSTPVGHLDIKSEKSNDKIDYKKDGQYVTYTPKGGNNFTVVKEDKTEIWEAINASEYSSKVEVDLMNNDAKAITVYLPENKTKVFKKDGANKLWKEIDTTKANPILVDIKLEHPTYFSTNNFNNNVRTFEAKTGFSFNAVREGDNLIWSTSNAKEYFKKVVAEGDKVTIHIGEGTTASTKVFNKGSDGNWAEDTSSQGTGTGGSGA